MSSLRVMSSLFDCASSFFKKEVLSDIDTFVESMLIRKTIGTVKLVKGKK